MICQHPCDIIYGVVMTLFGQSNRKKGGIMGIFAEWREKVPFIKGLVNAQKTVWYPVLFAALCILGGINDHTVYIPVMWVLIAFHLFSVLFTDDNKVFLTPLCMIYFAIGCDTDPGAFGQTGGELLSFMSDDALGHIIAMGIVGVGSFLIRLFVDGSIARVLKKRRAFTWGIIAMDVAFMLNGIGSPTYNTANIGYGALLAMGFTVVYFLVSGMIENSEDPVTYGCYVMVGTAYIALIQALVVAWRLHSDGKLILNASTSPIINKGLITLGWGISTVIAAVFVLGIPAAMYLAKNRRGSLFTYFSCFLFICGSIIVNTRSAMIVSIGAFAICTLVCCIRGRNKRAIRIYAIIGLALAVTTFAYILKNVMTFDELLTFLRIDEYRDSGRGSLWKNGIEDFKNSPVFGAGFSDGGYPDNKRFNNFYSNMYHCILVQMPGAMGTVGCIAILVHFVELAKTFFKNFSVDKMLLLFVPLMIIGMSLLDNFFFYLEFQIFYGVFLALAEKQSEQRELSCE